ncbi:rRNA pseudouridine synthase [Candidatus Bipolaricaulota bacterium]|nr:rRNA pseudouridine synthase [Candidatus Bipolaricaulota bacterium]
MRYLIGTMNDEHEQIKLWRIVQEESGVSRRKAQDLIASGEVNVNGVTVRDPFSPVARTSVSSLRLRGHPLSLEAPQRRIYRYNKEAGVLCSHDDPHSGNTLGRILRGEGFIGYNWAGRLDQDAEGLVLITNDGRIVQRLTHPSFRVRKVYHVWLSRFPKAQEMRNIYAEMRRGIRDDHQLLRIINAQTTGRPPHAVITIAEGRKHEIKRLFSHFGLQVVRLRRVSLGPISLGNLKPGAIVRLDKPDIAKLNEFVSRLAPTRSGEERSATL